MVNRFNDFTPTHIPQADSTGQQCSSYLMGINFRQELLSFLNTIQSDIIPFIDKQYKTTANKGLIRAFAWGFCWLLSLTRPELVPAIFDEQSLLLVEQQ